MTEGMLIFYGGIGGLIFTIVFHIISSFILRKKSKEINKKIKQQYD